MPEITPVNPKSSKTQLIVVVAILAVSYIGFMICYFIFLFSLGFPGFSSSNHKSTGQTAGNTIMVGSQRYINACQVVPTSQYRAIFGYEKSNKTNSVDIHAEGSETKRAVVNSSCTTTFGYVPPVNNDPLTQGDRGRLVLLIDQYVAGDSMAAENFRQDASNSFSYTQTKIGDTTVAYSKTQPSRFEFAYKNSIISVDVSPTTYYQGTDKLVVTNQYTAGVAAKLVPIITAAIDSKNLSQAALQSPDAGKQMNGAGSAVVVNSCQVFTTADFEAVINGKEDTTEVGSEIPNNPIEHGAKVQTLANGRDSTSCSRQGLITTQQPRGDYQSNPQAFVAEQQAYSKIISPTMRANYQLYNSDSEAVQGGNEKAAGVKASYADLKTTPINGVGDRALLLDYHLVSQSAGASEYNDPRNHEVHLYVVKGPYLIDIQIAYAPGVAAADQSTGYPGTQAQYAKAGQLLANRLQN